jgi:hypothetical protein
MARSILSRQLLAGGYRILDELARHIVKQMR